MDNQDDVFMEDIIVSMENLIAEVRKSPELVDLLTPSILTVEEVIRAYRAQ